MSSFATVSAVDTDQAIDSINDSFDRLVIGARRTIRRSAAALAADLQPAAWPVFREVVRAERVQVGAIVSALEMDKGAVSRYLKDLREHGLVESARDEHDARIVWITATADARDRVAALAAEQRVRMHQALAGWSEEDIERFAELLDRFSRPAAVE
ncbi:MarR family transcriptional regulator [Amnibacterium setariae]|uniref:MarR family transcriptional regulator n=1 Tax=Amnibacterium setariae TaxID=2306585 RepID=A0A3A1TYM3_9MICO|nr:MarR family transcriptional regulator [Amnibacterium setariae]